MRELLLHLTGEFLDAEIVDEDLHPLLVDVVAPRVPVPHAQDRLAIAEQSVRRAERADQLGDEGGAPHAAAGLHFEAVLARVVAHEAQAPVVPAARRPVARARGEGQTALPRRLREFRVAGLAPA